MAAPKAPKEILIGAPSSLTGMFAGTGQGGSSGGKVAVEDINRLGGVYVKEYGKKIPIKLVLVDVESDMIKTKSVTEHLVLRDKVHMLATLMEVPPISAANAMVAEKYKVPHACSIGPMEPFLGMRHSVDVPWKYTWNTGFSVITPIPPGDFRHGKGGYTIMDTWMDMLDNFGHLTNKKVGIFASDEPDGRGWWATFGPELKKLGYDVIGYGRNVGLFPLGTTDFSSVVKEWKNNNVEMLWGNCPGPDFGVLWRQCHAQGFKPKMVIAARAALFWEDASTWGGNLPLGVGIEMWWHQDYTYAPGIGGRTPKSLAERWVKDTGKPVNQALGHGYVPIQVLVNAVERAGTLDKEAVNKAIGETDLLTINHRVKYNKEEQFSWVPLFFGQWMKTDKPWKWDLKVVFSKHDFVPVEAKPIFPIPYD
ncbi:MAG: ABC transporter substrate-binding protein [Thermoplasmata archaeon]|nr:MAG: ABC transporter substrate-binding protein [Thermoplasmata archaeon]